MQTVVTAGRLQWWHADCSDGRQTTVMTCKLHEATCHINSAVQSPSWKCTSFLAGDEIRRIYESKRFTLVFTTAHYLLTKPSASSDRYNGEMHKKKILRLNREKLNVW